MRGGGEGEEEEGGGDGDEGKGGSREKTGRGGGEGRKRREYFQVTVNTARRYKTSQQK